MKENTPDDLVQAYLNGQLAGPELEVFKKRLASDSNLAQELALQRAEMAASELLIASETRDLFRAWQQPHKQATRKKLIGWIAGFAAVVALSFTALWIWRQPSNTPALQAPETKHIPAADTPAPATAPQLQQPIAGDMPEKPAPAKNRTADYRLLASKYMPEPVLSNLRRGPADSTASDFSRAQQAYAAGDYQRTLDLLALVDSARQQSATYLSANALYHLQQYKQAEAQFDRLVEMNSRQYRYPSEWGLLMCRLADFPQRKTEVRQQLNAILANPEHPYFEQAKALKKELNE